jgi:predicted PurR-regulated permease PerM
MSGPTAKGHALALVKAALNLIPVVGGAIIATILAKLPFVSAKPAVARQANSVRRP